MPTDENGIYRLSDAEILSQINSYTASAQYVQIKRNFTYYLGANQTIINQDDKTTEPDNKIPVSFGRKIINTISGYAAKPGLISFKVKDPGTEGDSPKDDLILEEFEKSKEALETNKIFIDANTAGVGYEVHFVDGDIPEFARVDPQQMLVHYSNDIRPVIEWAIRFWSVTDLEGKTVRYADVYYPDKIYKYMNTGGNYILQGKPIEHKYGEVPIVDYQVNNERQGVFEHVLTLVDSHDVIISEDIANELGRFADAYLKLSKKLNPEDIDKIKDMKIFDNLGTEGDFVEWLIKSINDDFVQNSANRFERLIYEMSQTPNFNDEKFNQKSGIAIAFALVDFENLVSSIEAYFTKGLHKRIRLLNTVNQEMKSAKPVEFHIKWTRNLPFNFGELAEIVVKLMPILSRETLLKLFPAEIIDDVEAEIERKKKEQDEAVARMQAQFSGEGPDQEDQDDNQDDN